MFKQKRKVPRSLVVTSREEIMMMDQYIRNAISFIGAIVFVFGGLYLADLYSGWRLFADRTISDTQTRVAALSGAYDQTATSQESNRIFQCIVEGRTVTSFEPCDHAKVQRRLQ
jgi:hypothetical protein